MPFPHFNVGSSSSLFKHGGAIFRRNSGSSSASGTIKKKSKAPSRPESPIEIIESADEVCFDKENVTRTSSRSSRSHIASSSHKFGKSDPAARPPRSKSSDLRPSSSADVFDTQSEGVYDEVTMMDVKKPFAAPPAPPQIPTHKNTPFKQINGNGTSNGNYAPIANGTSVEVAVNGQQSSMKPNPILPSIKKISAAPSPKHTLTGSTRFGTSSVDPSDHFTSKNGKREIQILRMNGFVGFDSLPYQYVHSVQRSGFQFNLLCVGETGMGKTTLVESLFNIKLEFEPCNSELKTVELRSKTCVVTENNVSATLRVVETAGFGDQLDKEHSARIIVDYINAQFEAYLKEELKVRRNLASYEDTRIHACLYFISPTGHGLKALDVVTIRELSKRVNVIPIIAKADTTCKDELARFKERIVLELKANNIEFYKFPIDDDAVKKRNDELNALMPFAVIGSTDFVAKEDGKSVRARRYPWGIVEVENEEHCDFVKLREALLRINVDALRCKTHKVLYEEYRRERLRQMKMNDGDCGSKVGEAYAQKEREFRDEMKRKDEEFQRQFIERVNAKEDELKRREEWITTRERELRSKFEIEADKVDAQINTLLDEKARLQGRYTASLSKKKIRS